VTLFNIPLPIYHNDNIIRAGSNNIATAVGWLQNYIYTHTACVNNCAPYGTYAEGDILYIKYILQRFYVNGEIGFALRENQGSKAVCPMSQTCGM
jgi:hypothetical protein